jgi:N-acetylmuramoyl-L-alanine amidase
MKKLFFALTLLFSPTFLFAQTATDLAGKKICIDQGHGGYNSNDRNVQPDPGINFWESESNYYKGLWVKSLLEARGAKVYLTRPNKDSLYDKTDPNNSDPDEPSLTARWTYANSNNVNWFHSIHSNATGGTNTSTNYTLLLVKEDQSSRQPVTWQSVEMSELIYTNIRAKDRTNSSGGNITGYPGVYKDYTFYGGTNGGFNLGVLNGLAMPGELSEGSFHDYYPETRRLMNNDYRKAEAYGIYNAFLEYWNVPFDTVGIICGTQKSGSTPINNIVVRLLPVNKVYHGDAYNNGYFLFDSLAPGAYKVVFETSGYSNDTVNVTLYATTRTIAGSAPVNSATNIDRDQQIHISFLHPVDTSSVKTKFSISPNIAGILSCNNTDTLLTFTPSAPMTFATNYTVTLAGLGETRQPTVFVDNTTVTSNATPSNYSITFQTELLPPFLVLTQPKQNDTAFVVTKQIGFKFSVSMDTASVRAALSIVPSVAGTFAWTNSNTTLLITPTGGLPYNTNYTATIGAQAGSIYGKPIDANKDSISGDPYVLTFKTQMNPTGVEQNINTPVAYSLGQNFPNPFNPSTTINFSLAEKQLVVLKVYDMLGREVAALVNTELDNGKYSRVFDASLLSSGIYFYKLETKNFTSIKKMMLLK